MKKYETRYGIELECFIKAESKEIFTNAIASHRIPLQVGGDGSIRVPDDAPYSSMELRTIGGQTYNQIKEITSIVSARAIEFHVGVNASCGYHLHISNDHFFEKLFMQRFILVWCAIEDVLLSTQPQSRYNNTYCKRYLQKYITNPDTNRLPKAKMELINILGGSKYFSLNTSALREHGTIEIRLHAGTVNKEKIIAWIDLMTAIIDYVEKRYNRKTVLQLFSREISDEKISEVFSLLQLPDYLKNHFNQRIEKFLYPTLQRQQKSAFLAMNLFSPYKRAKKLYEKSQIVFQEIDTKYRQAINELNI